ncbi:hypothetical protein QTG54_011669 [Skeletonema marinoi]|uniref:RING-type domain-containing protein n=1 Tax=Skeletonema marinoi TaxID=267567 RepID=A0AAD9D991_9STRA|nr:hypothetical protein QTG54_011669 [Skeletonema marinoi]
MQKRAAELHDEIIFKQPESSHLGDCPICCLPHPIGGEHSAIVACCSKIICKGCDHANQLREAEGNLQRKCPFCRHRVPASQQESKMDHMKRVEVNDPFAIAQMGIMRFYEGNYEGAFKYYTKAAELGDVESHYLLSTMYRGGLCEAENGNYERATRHLIIAASLGHEPSIEMLKANYTKGNVSKADFAAALRAHQAAIDATKSPQREAAEKWEKQQK